MIFRVFKTMYIVCRMDFGMLGVILLGVCTVVFVAWRVFFKWYGNKRKRTLQEWQARRDETTISSHFESKQSSI